MTLGQLARLSGKSALVLREMKIDENGPLHIHLKGRKAGLCSWLLAKTGVDDSSTFDVYEDRIEFSDGSWSGSFTETIPMTHVSNLGAGFLKPVAYMFLAVISLIAAIPTFGITLILTALFTYMYYTQKSLFVYFIPDSGSVTSLCFKRSVIEGVAIGDDDADRIIGIIALLVEKNTKR